MENVIFYHFTKVPVQGHKSGHFLHILLDSYVLFEQGSSHPLKQCIVVDHKINLKSLISSLFTQAVTTWHGAIVISPTTAQILSQCGLLKKLAKLVLFSYLVYYFTYIASIRYLLIKGTSGINIKALVWVWIVVAPRCFAQHSNEKQTNKEREEPRGMIHVDRS